MVYARIHQRAHIIQRFVVVDDIDGAQSFCAFGRTQATIALKDWFTLGRRQLAGCTQITANIVIGYVCGAYVRAAWADYVGKVTFRFLHNVQFVRATQVDAFHAQIRFAAEQFGRIYHAFVTAPPSERLFAELIQ